MSLISKNIQYFSRNSSLVSRKVLPKVNSHQNVLSHRHFSTRLKHNVKGIFKIGLAGVTVGALVGTGYSIHSMNQPRGHILNDQINIPVIKAVPHIAPTRKVRFQNDDSGLKLTLYQYQTCPFCCKVRAFLDYSGISYDIVEVDPVLRQAIKWSDYKKVPILVAQTADGYQPLNDSTMIISAISSYMEDPKRELTKIVSYYPFISFLDENGTKKHDIMNKYFLMLGNQSPQNINPKEISEERKWRQWADNVLVHTLSPNVYRTKDEAIQAFTWFSEVGEWDKNFPAWERNLIVYVGALAMWILSKELKKRYHLKDDVRESLYDECNFWLKAVNAKGGKFIGGENPNLADISVYGVLSSIEGCLAFNDLLKHSKIERWYLAMKDAVKHHGGTQLVV